MKKLKMLLAVIVMLSTPMIVQAHDIVDMNQLGTIQIDLNYDGEDVKGGSLTIYQVGDVVHQNGDFIFEASSAFAGANGDFSDVTSKDLADLLAKYATNHNVAALVTIENETGSVTFEELKPGLYLIMQNESAKGYAPLESFLVSLPVTVDEMYEYHVNATPKISLEKLPDPPSPPDIPQTGVLNWPVPVMASLGVLFIAIGWSLRNKNEE